MYLSPEIILRAGHNFLTDIYALGVLTYELVSGNTPFQSNCRNSSQLKSDILMSEIDFNRDLFSPELKDLLQ
jgi:serine/threonine protein kinase